ncbi:MAG: diguanylate cyclase [Solirubrobacterales bacterium]|nr:diguanylate cyclase [Solirubrobacterales bacterium]
MSPIELVDAESATERLLERSWERRDRRASQRELIVDATAGVLFVVVAVALLLAWGLAGLDLSTAAVLIGVYALASRIEFPVGAGYVVPTQLVLVPMLLILPPAAVPGAVGLGMVIGNAVDCASGRVAPRRVLSAVPDAWHAVGPAVVLLLAGSPVIGLEQVPLLAAAFAAGCVVDLASTLVRMCLAGGVPELSLQMRVFAVVWAVDACLAPLGFLAGIATRQHDSAILFVLPLVVLLRLLARDRSQRIEKAHRQLKLVERERARLQSAVRRLGDAFAAKLELGALLEILLNGSIEAVDAAVGRLELSGGPSPVQMSVGAVDRLPELASKASGGCSTMSPVQTRAGDKWQLNAPMRISARPTKITGSLSLVRSGRAFDADEIALIFELIAKAELAAAEIIAHHAIREQAMTDALTGLGNRRRLTSDLKAEFDEANPEPSLLLLFDLDGFKDYNDAYGHLAGDELLARLGGRLQRAVEEVGCGYRLGGDEFCAHLRLDRIDPDPLIARAAAALAEAGPEYSIQASLGVVLLPQEADNAQRALRLADERMYANKRSRSTAARSQAAEVLLRTIEARQPELEEHSTRVATLATKVALRLGMTGEELDEVSCAARLHDIGKVAIPDAILNKAGRLTGDEWELVRSHTIIGDQILRGAPALRPVAGLVRASHERWDGAGYPDRLGGQAIPLGARIVGVCDAYEAMTTTRSYRAATSHETACAELLRCAGAQFDPDVVGAFLTITEGDRYEPESEAFEEVALAA